MVNAARVLNLEEVQPLAKSQDVDIIRIFNAPVDRLWSAWSNEDFIQRWWGPEGFTSSGAQIDFRVGGHYLLGMRAPDGMEHWSAGRYQEIVEGRRIEALDTFSDREGNRIENLTLTLDFDELDDGRTRMILKYEGVPSEMYDDCVAGWNGSLDKLQLVVEE